VKKYNIAYPIHQHKLKNGLTVLVVEDDSLPMINYTTTFKAGSRNESQKTESRHGITGISHLFEHMMFNGSKKYGAGEFDRLLESNGGYSNAWTSKDMTSYYEVFPSSKLELIVDMESDRMSNLDLTETMFLSEKEVVKEEHRMSVENSIPGTMWEMLYEHAFSVHPYHWPVIGWMEDLNQITLTDCKSYYKQLYSPSNAVISIAGSVNADAVFKQLENKYGDIPGFDIPSTIFPYEKFNKGEKRVELRRPAEIESWLIGYLCCKGTHPHMPALDIIQQILLNGDSSRLVHSLVHDRTMVLDISGAFNWGIDPNLFYFGFRVPPGKSGEDALLQFTSHLEKLALNPVSNRELEKAKNQLISELVHDNSTLMGKCADISAYSIIFNDPKLIFNMIDRYLQVTIEDIKTVAEKYLTSDNRTIIQLIPQSSK
jgi:zinc protease